MFVEAAMPLSVKAEDNLWESILSFHMGLVDWAQVVSPGNKCHNLLCHLIGPELFTTK